jgi:hypothetical protein
MVVLFSSRILAERQQPNVHEIYLALAFITYEIFTSWSNQTLTGLI